MTSDLKRCLLFLEMLALVFSESSFCAYVCHEACRLHRGQRHLLSHQAVGLGAPQTIIRRPLPSPDRHDNLVHAGYSCGCLGASSWPTFFYRLHVCNFHTGILQCAVENVLTKVLTDLQGIQVFSFSETILHHFFF